MEKKIEEMTYYQLRAAYKPALDELASLWSATPDTLEDGRRRLAALKVKKIEAALFEPPVCVV